MKFKFNPEGFMKPTPRKVRVWATAWLSACMWGGAYITMNTSTFGGLFLIATGFIAKFLSECVYEEDEDKKNG